jgi:hypothetical protein
MMITGKAGLFHKGQIIRLGNAQGGAELDPGLKLPENR